jgi:hypothetical protein
MANTKITNPELFNLGDSTSATQLPVMTTTERIAMTGLSVGEMIFNSDTDKVEYFDGTKWYGITYEVTGESPYNGVLYTGNGTSNSSEQSITGVGFQPDFVWIKNRGEGRNHVLVDSLRKTGSLYDELHSNNTDPANTTGTDNVKTLGSDGFTVLGEGSETNDNGDTFVAWCFKAGGAAVTNADGTLNSQVSANVLGGFSIVSYTGNGSAGATVGHGIDTPELIIVKRLSGVENWAVYSAYSHPTVPQNYLLTLDNNSAAGLNSTRWNNTAPTNAVFSVGASQAVNASANTYIAYCFHSVPGFSKVGSYTGTGAAGNKVVTGFEPAFVMVKRTDSTQSWGIYDNKRVGTSETPQLLANVENAEAEEPLYFEIDGFRLDGSQTIFNGSSGTYMYIAFA